MKPVEFKEQNIIFAKDQKPYLPLPAHKHGDDWDSVSSCWALNFRERIKVLFTGKVYTTLSSFGKPLTPQKVTVDNPCL